MPDPLFFGALLAEPEDDFERDFEPDFDLDAVLFFDEPPDFELDFALAPDFFTFDPDPPLVPAIATSCTKKL